MSLNVFFEVAGALIAIVFIWINIRARKSLIGSFFKQYYGLMIAGAVLMFLGFTSESFGKWLGIPEEINEVVHHLELLMFGVVFIYAARILPKEAAKQVEMK